MFAIFSLACLLYCAYIGIKAASSKLRELPGPLLARISSYYRVWLLSTGRGPAEYLELHRKYGSVVRTGPHHVSFSDPAMISVVYDLKHRFHKSHFYDVFKPLYQGAPMDTIFTTANPLDKRDSKNSLVVHMTSCPSDYQPLIEQSVERFVGCMQDMQGKSVDFFIWPFYWGLDMTFAIMFGNHFGFMDSRSDFNGMISAFIKVARYAALLGQVPEWCPILLGNQTFMSTMKKWIPNFPDPTQSFLMEIEKQIEVHDQSAHVCGNSFLCRVLGDRNSKNVSSYETVNLLFESFFAASIESAVTIRTIFYCLLTCGDVYKRLVLEIRHPEIEVKPAGFQQKDTGSSSTRFLNAVIKECLRLHTSNCPPMERIVPEPGIESGGYAIPPGTVVSVAHYVTHRDPNVFGRDAEVFRPERWLEASPEALRRMEHNFMAFGKGNRACAGRELGMLELRMFLVGVLQKFDIEWAEHLPKSRIDMYWIIEHYGVDIRFRERTKKL